MAEPKSTVGDDVPTVFIVDDDTAVVTSLSRLLHAEGYRVRPYHSAGLFLKDHDPSVVGCVLLDHSLPDLTGLEVQAALVTAPYVRPVIFLSGTADVPASVQAMKGGAIDFLVKPVGVSELSTVIRKAIERDIEQRQVYADRDRARRLLQTLSPREREVLTHIVAGRMNKQIAAELGTVEKTIKVHRGHIMKKLRVTNVPDLVRLVSKGQSLPQPSGSG